LPSLQLFQNQVLSEKGFNLTAIFNLSEMDNETINSLQQHCEELKKYQQLILIAHAGKQFWTSLQESQLESANPVDDFTIKSIEQFFLDAYPDKNHEIIYPTNQGVGLQYLGSMAGWHHPSPFKVGINHDWGSWFAYRAVILVDSNFALTTRNLGISPCQTCLDKLCIKACPADALEGGEFAFNKCISYRKKSSSLCQYKCLARISCPVGSQHRYSEEQIHYHYSVSLKMIKRMY